MSYRKGDFWIHCPYILDGNLSLSFDIEDCCALLLSVFSEDRMDVSVFLSLSFDACLQELCAQKNISFLEEELPFILSRYEDIHVYRTLNIWLGFYAWDAGESLLDAPVDMMSAVGNTVEPSISFIDSLEGLEWKGDVWSPFFQRERFGRVVSAHTMVSIPPGSFEMGRHDDYYAEVESRPLHRVHITRPFWMSAYPVPQLIFEQVLNRNPSRNRIEPYLPVENVTWCEAVLFCNELSRKEGLALAYDLPAEFENSLEYAACVVWNRGANGYRLPTEAEWEYCAKAGLLTTFSGGDELDSVGWFDKNSRSRIQFVGEKQANPWGLCDMSGNVSEWVWDTPIRVYENKVEMDPILYEPAQKSTRIYRGGSCLDESNECSVSYRRFGVADARRACLGFRVIRGMS